MRRESNGARDESSNQDMGSVTADSAGSYRHLSYRSESVGSPRAARAVGNAVAANSIAYLIPCHRVIRATGVVGNYRWGQERKRAMLGWEAAQAVQGLGENSKGSRTKLSSLAE
jgi:O-6-methylguanine DNA methyltransferase